MFAVSNTTPLRYLIAVGRDGLLGALFDRVIVPQAVFDELPDPRTPQQVRLRVLSLPRWFEVCEAPQHSIAAFPLALHRGERDTILLAEALRPDVVLLDEYFGRTIAQGRGLAVSGTLGILERADAIGLVTDFPELLREIKASGFFIGNTLEQQLLQRHRLRQGSK